MLLLWLVRKEQRSIRTLLERFHHHRQSCFSLSTKISIRRCSSWCDKHHSVTDRPSSDTRSKTIELIDWFLWPVDAKNWRATDIQHIFRSTSSTRREDVKRRYLMISIFFWQDPFASHVFATCTPQRSYLSRHTNSDTDDDRDDEDCDDDTLSPNDSPPMRSSHSQVPLTSTSRSVRARPVCCREILPRWEVFSWSEIESNPSIWSMCALPCSLPSTRSRSYGCSWNLFSDKIVCLST